MKICISSNGTGLEATVCKRFGKAPYFLIVHTDTMEHEFVENLGMGGPKAGIVAARILLDKEVDAVLSGEVGPNAASILKLGDVRIFEGADGSESLREVIEKFKSGAYREST